jgi:hypothetical protein
MIDNRTAIRIGQSYGLPLSDCVALGAFAQNEGDAHEIAAMFDARNRQPRRRPALA